MNVESRKKYINMKGGVDNIKILGIRENEQQIEEIREKKDEEI